MRGYLPGGRTPRSKRMWEALYHFIPWGFVNTSLRTDVELFVGRCFFTSSSVFSPVGQGSRVCLRDIWSVVLRQC